MELRRDAQRVVAADWHECIDAMVSKRFDDAHDPVLLLGRVGARSAQDGAAHGQDAAHVRRGQFIDQTLFHAAGPAVLDAAHLVPQLEGPTGDRADRRVKARRVSTAGQDPDAHGKQIKAARIFPVVAGG